MTNDEAAKILSSFSVDDMGEISRNYWYKEIQKDTEEAINLAVKALKQQKTAHWILSQPTYAGLIDIECSNCHMKGTILDEYLEGLNYCQECGAKMEVRNDNKGT